MSLIRVRTPATTANLGAGFDSLGLALALHNHLEVEPCDAGLEVTISGEGAGVLPRDESHAAVRAMQHLFHAAGRSLPPVRVRQENAIPLTRGLGSSSAAIVAGLAAANALAGGPFDTQGLLDMAAALDGHPDNVAACLVGALAVTAMEGKRVHYARVPVPGDLGVALYVPEFELSTAESRGRLPESYSRRDAVFTLSRAALTTAAFATGRWGLLRVGMQDHLHQPYRSEGFPELPFLICAALDAGACGAALSGSGPTVVAFTEGPADAVACALSAEGRRFGVPGRALCVGVDEKGTEVSIDG